MSEHDTRTVVQRHLQAWRSGNVPDLLADYANDAVMLSQAGGVVAGKAAIGAMFTQIFAQVFPPHDTVLEVTAELISGDHALVHWTATTSVLRTIGGFDSFVLHNGLIIAQCGGAVVEPAG